ncbi:hypothetical protein D3C77_336350 [compost metagenome]
MEGMQLPDMIVELLLQSLVIVNQIVQLTGLTVAASVAYTLPNACSHRTLLAFVAV